MMAKSLFVLFELLLSGSGESIETLFWAVALKGMRYLSPDGSRRGHGTSLSGYSATQQIKITFNVTSSPQPCSYDMYK
jgi:hypothetical protein